MRVRVLIVCALTTVIATPVAMTAMAAPRPPGDLDATRLGITISARRCAARKRPRS